MSNTIGDMVVAITGDTSNFNLSIDQASKKFDSLTTIIANSTTNMAASFKKIDNEAKLWGNSTDLIKEKQIELKNEMTSLMSQGFDPLSPKIQSLKTQYDALGKEAEALNKQHVTLKGSLQEIDGMMDGFGSKILKLMANPYVLAAAAIIGTIKVFTDFTKELVEYGAHIQETSEKTGVSTKALQEWKYVAEQTGGSLETITSSIKLMTRGLETNKDTFAKLGIQTKDINGQFLSTTEIFDSTVKKLGDLSNDTERTNLALKLFGRGALDMVPLLKEGSKGIEELKQKANDLGLVLSDKTISGARDLEKQTAALNASWKSFTMQLVQDSIPALTTIVNRLNEVATIAHLKGVVEENNKIIASYEYLRDDVIAYHDALESNLEIAERDVKSTYTTQKVKQDAAKKIIELTQSLQYIESEYNRKKKIQDDKDAETARKKAADDSALQKSKQEQDELQGLRDARDKATKEYNDSIKLTSQLQSKGLRTTEEATKEVTDATKKYAEALAPIVAASGSNKIGAEALQSAKDTLDKLTQAENIYTDDKKAHDEAILARSKSYSDAIKAQMSDEEKAKKTQTDKYNKEVSDRDKVLKESDDAYDKLLNGEFKTFDDIEKAKTKAEKSGAIDQVDIDKAATEAKIKLVSEYVGQAIKITSDMMSKIASIYNMDVDNKKTAIAQELKAAEDAIDKELEAKEEAAGVATKTAKETADEELRIATDTYNGKLQLIDAEKDALDKEEEAKLYSLGLVEASTLEEYDAEIAAAIAAGDTITANNLQKERDKLAIQQEYDKKRKAIDDAETLRLAIAAATKAQLEQDAADKKLALEKQAAQDTYKIELASFKTNQALDIVSATITGIQAVLNAYSWAAKLGGPVAGGIAAAIVAALMAAQIATIANETPPTAPALAEGGIVMPSNGGALVNVAEAGKPEVVFPLEKLDQFINQGTMGSGGSSDIPINMTIQLDSQILYSGIFAATRNKTVLISAKAVV